MLILDPYGMTFDAVGVFALAFWLLFKSGLSYFEVEQKVKKKSFLKLHTVNFDFDSFI